MASSRLRRFALAVLVVLPIAGCVSTQDALPPQVRLADISFQDASLFEQRLRIDLRLGNPNDITLPIDGLTFKLELNDVVLSEGFSNESVDIPRLSEAKVPVTASTTLLDIVRQILALRQQRNSVTYRISGLVYLSGLTRRSVPYEKSGKLELLPSTSTTNTLVPR